MAALLKVAREYNEPKPALDKLNSSRKNGTNSEIRNVWPKLENKVKETPNVSILFS